MRGDFGKLTIRRVEAKPDKIRVVAPDNDGNEAIFTFELEANAPYTIAQIGVDILNVSRL